jgi:putative heme-binding domain-containing protein
VQQALSHRDPDLRIAALRAGRQIGVDPVTLARQLADDPEPRVRREAAIALRRQQAPSAAEVWASLATRHDGKDRWYLEALGIGADGQWDRFLAAWLKEVGHSWNTAAGRDVLWRSRARATPGYLVRILQDQAGTDSNPARYLRAFDFLSGPEKLTALVELATTTNVERSASGPFIVVEALQRLDEDAVRQNPKLQAALGRVLYRVRGSETFVELVRRFSVAERYPDLAQLAGQRPNDSAGIEAARVLLEKQQELLAQSLAAADAETAAQLVQAVGNTGDARATGLLRQVLGNSAAPAELRRRATRALARTRPGAMQLLNLARRKKLDEPLLFAAGAALSTAPWDDVRQQARELFPIAPARNNQPLPPLAQLLGMRGNVASGKVAFETKGTCATCHLVHGQGKEVGPNLSEIGSKLSREALFESILFPSAGISHNYESSIIALGDGDVLTGIITSETADAITVKLADAMTRTLKKSGIVERKRSNVSLMPADVHKDMSAQDLADVVEFLTTLRAASQ